MALDQNQPFGGQPAPSEPTLTEQQIRTMRGDLSQASGQPAGPMSAEPKLNINPKPMFDADEPAFSPNTSNQMPSSVDALIAAEGGKRKFFLLLGGIAGVLVLGLVGYFFIYPILSSTPEAPSEPTAPATAPETPAAPAVIPQTPSPAKPTSAFVNEPTARVTVTINGDLSKENLMAALAKQAAESAPGTTEVVVQNTGSAPIAFSAAMNALLPTFTSAKETATLFTDEVTAYIYKDGKGSWPGYIATLKPGFTADALRAWFTSLEKAPVSNLFLSSPGNLGSFKDGMVNGRYPDRYAPGSIANTSFSYLMLPTQNKVILSTSFEGLKEAITLMGL